MIRDVDSERFINLSNVVPIISDPLLFDDFIDNWENLGFKFEPLELKIIKTDKDFDNYMRMFFADDKTPIIDPIFDKNFKLKAITKLAEVNLHMQFGANPYLTLRRYIAYLMTL